MITAAGRMLWQFGKGATRLTKHLSPWKSKLKYGSKGNPLKDKTGKSRITSFAMGKGSKEIRPWAQGTLSAMKKVGFSKGARTKTLYGYTRGTKHIAKNKKLYGSGIAGAAIWDVMDRDD